MFTTDFALHLWSCLFLKRHQMSHRCPIKTFCFGFNRFIPNLAQLFMKRCSTNLSRLKSFDELIPRLTLYSFRAFFIVRRYRWIFTLVIAIQKWRFNWSWLRGCWENEIFLFVTNDKLQKSRNDSRIMATTNIMRGGTQTQNIKDCHAPQFG